jgi:hypothetical protein
MRPLKKPLDHVDNFSSIINSILYLNAELDERDALYHEGKVKVPFVLLVDELPALAGRCMVLDYATRKNTAPSPRWTRADVARRRRRKEGLKT